MAYTLTVLETNQHRFFEMLPKEWQDAIVPFWDAYKDAATIYGFEEDGNIIAGGIVFSTCPPDLFYYKNEAQQWFDKGYLYIGFLFVSEMKRNHNIGTIWLQQLKAKLPKQKFWLLIEEAHLHHFYKKNGFVLAQTLTTKELTEWLYLYQPVE
ncbi:MAG: GNAT family N-acetyltransferase [Gelidibacter sp.]